MCRWNISKSNNSNINFIIYHVFSSLFKSKQVIKLSKIFSKLLNQRLNLSICSKLEYFIIFFVYDNLFWLIKNLKINVNKQLFYNYILVKIFQCQSNFFRQAFHLRQNLHFQQKLSSLAVQNHFFLVRF